MDQENRLEYLIDYLLDENPNAEQQIKSFKRKTLDEKITLFRGLCNIRPPEPVTEQFIRVQDAFLTAWNHDRSLTSLDDLKAIRPQLYLWQGDITTLAVDAIVNARSEEHTSELQSRGHLVCRLLLEKKKLETHV